MSVQSARGERVAVVSGHQLGTTIAATILEQGGNTVDAAIAGAAGLVVALPHACALGGDCFILVHRDNETYCINGSGASPGALPSGLRKEQLKTGALSCAVPGMVGAWEALHRRFGSKPWKDLLEPAARAARAGIPVARDFAAALAENTKHLAADPGCREVFLSDGKTPERGASFTQPALADTLDTIGRDGAATLYGGPVGASLCTALAAAGGVLTLGDLKQYQPLWVKPLACSYRGHVVRAAPPNSFGIALLLQLALLNGADLSAAKRDPAGRLRLLMAAARTSFKRCATLLADPRNIKASPADVLEPAAVAALRQSAFSSPADLPRARGTAVISVADAKGNGVTIVQSVFLPFGSLIADAKTGIVLNNRMFGFSVEPDHPNAIAPNKRPGHTLCPAMAIKDGRLRYLMGSPGGTGQTITLTQVLTNLVDLNFPLDEAVAAPRWSMDIEGNFVVEKAIAGIIPELAKAGLSVRAAETSQRFFFGSAEAIEIGGNGLLAVADDRRDAAAWAQ